jgi:dephospho-CoA kinase
MRREVILIAVTGGIGTGKSTVSRIFASCGAFRIDADEVARHCMEPGKPLYNDVVAHFGDRILSFDEIDRGKLADVVFNDPKELAKLNSMCFPSVRQQIINDVEPVHHKVVVLDIPLLFESNFHKDLLVDKIVLVTAPLEQRYKRLELRSNLSREQVDRRIASQWSDPQKIGFADFHIHNDGELQDIETEVRRIYEQVERNEDNIILGTGTIRKESLGFCELTPEHQQRIREWFASEGIIIRKENENGDKS